MGSERPKVFEPGVLACPHSQPRDNRITGAAKLADKEPQTSIPLARLVRVRDGLSQGFNEALRLALTLRELGWACCIENADGQVIAE